VATEAAEHHPERFAEFLQGMVSRARANPDPYSAEAQIVMEEMIRCFFLSDHLIKQARTSTRKLGNGVRKLSRKFWVSHDVVY
jgi:hypothetical protein